MGRHSWARRPTRWEKLERKDSPRHHTALLSSPVSPGSSEALCYVGFNTKAKKKKANCLNLYNWVLFFKPKFILLFFWLIFFPVGLLYFSIGYNKMLKRAIHVVSLDFTFDNFFRLSSSLVLLSSDLSGWYFVHPLSFHSTYCVVSFLKAHFIYI